MDAIWNLLIMAKRLSLKKGDLFEVKIQEENECFNYYFQFLLNDSLLFDSNIIRVFDCKIKCERNPTFKDIVNNKIKFHTHVVIKGGIQLGLWEKIGNIDLQDGLELPYFRDTNNYGVDKSDDWFIWKPNERHIEIGELTEEAKKYDIGGVFHPLDVVEWLRTGNHGFKLPE